MVVLVTGAGGQLGYDVLKEFQKRKINCIGVDKNNFDITDRDAVVRYVTSAKPDCVVHCAAYTKVDNAERAGEKQKCFEVNADGTRNIAEACKIVDAKLVYISTDYVFDGKKQGEYEVDDKPNPIGVYGESKYEGEKAVKAILDKYFILRTSWMFGRNGNNFVKKILRRTEEKKIIDVVGDQIGSPTYTVDLARLIADMVSTEKYGVYHATNEGFCSWAEFAEKIIELGKKDNVIRTVASKQYKLNVARPENSKLSKKSLDKSGFNRLPEWQDALAVYFNEE